MAKRLGRLQNFIFAVSPDLSDGRENNIPRQGKQSGVEGVSMQRLEPSHGKDSCSGAWPLETPPFFASSTCACNAGPRLAYESQDVWGGWNDKAGKVSLPGLGYIHEGWETQYRTYVSPMLAPARAATD